MSTEPSLPPAPPSLTQNHVIATTSVPGLQSECVEYADCAWCYTARTGMCERCTLRAEVERMRPVFAAGLALGRWIEEADPQQKQWNALWEKFEEAVANV